MMLFVVGGIIFAITFVEKLPGSENALHALKVSALALLSYMPILLPLTAFMGTLLAMYGLIRSSEYVIVSCSGLSPWQIMRPFLVSAGIIGVLATTVVYPWSVSLNRKSMDSGHMELVDNAIWIHEKTDTGSLTMRMKSVSSLQGGDVSFRGVAGFTQDNDGMLLQRIEADAMTLSGNIFSAKNATIFETNGNIRHGMRWTVNAARGFESMMERYLTPEQMSFWRLPVFIQESAKVGIDARAHLVHFWNLLFLPLSLIAMTVLGFAFSQTRQRRNFSFGIKFSLGILICFILYFTTKVFAALGTSGTLPALISIVTPPVLIITAAAIFIVSYDSI